MSPAQIQQAFALANQHHHAGRLGEAEPIYRQILSAQPDHADALHHLGVLAHQVGRNSIAVDLIRQAISLRPDHRDAYSNLGLALQAIGNVDDAIAAFEKAISLRPDYPEAHNNLGVALTFIGRPKPGADACRKAIALRPTYTQAYLSLGLALDAAGESEAAISTVRTAVGLFPKDARCHFGLATILSDIGQLDAAIRSYRDAVSLDPSYTDAFNNLAGALKESGRLTEAIDAYRHAIHLRPDFAEAYSNLGVVLAQAEHLDDAIAACQRCISLKPEYSAAHTNLGNSLMNAGRADEAVEAYRRAASLASLSPQAHSNFIYALHYHPGCTAADIARAHRAWNEQHALPLRTLDCAADQDASPFRRLRVGYVSADFRDHVVGRNILPLYKHHDRGNFELFTYANVMKPDRLTEEFRQLSDCWRNIIGASDEKVAELICKDGIDILVDLTLHMAGNRLLVFAQKPAPIQVTFAGYPASTGLTAIDYRLSDPYLDPLEKDQSVYSEQTVRLPHSFWCYDPLENADLRVGSLPSLKAGYITFGCLNNFCKVNHRTLSLWAAVLEQVEDSRLILLAPFGGHRQNASDLFSRAGIEASRIEFAAKCSRRQYLELYHRIDIGLDSFPYNGHTTSLDSFWMGVPVVTLVGETPVSRAGWCQLSNLDLTELAARSPEQFVKIAVDLANDLPRLALLRSTLRQRIEASPLMDAPGFARGIESVYRRMWETWCRGR